MKIVISTHQGVVINTEAKYLLVHTDRNEFGILENHVPVITVIDEGYVKLCYDGIEGTNEEYIYLCGGVFELHNNEALVLAQEAESAKNLEEAKNILLSKRKQRQDSNKLDSVNFTKKEKELMDNIKNANASNL